VAKVQASELDAYYNSEPEPERGRRIIDVKPSATVATTKLQLGEPDEPEEGERLFHSQMWVKGTLLHFIIDSGSHKNLISKKFIKRLPLPTMSHPQTIHHWCNTLFPPVCKNNYDGQELWKTQRCEYVILNGP
jgi:hypothetical protein